MIKFQHPEALYLLLGIIPLVGLFILFIVGRNKAVKRMGEKSLVFKLMPDRPTFKHSLKFILGSLAYVFLIIALANPQIGRSYEEVSLSGIDLMIALDVSNSMLSEDEKPSRLDRAKLFVKRLIDELAGDRVGLVIFAGNAYMQVPITSDYAAAQTLLRYVSPRMVPRQGTAIGEAIRISKEALGSGQNKYKAILVISDGENHEGDALKAAKEVSEEGIVIHTMGIGSTNGAPIPEYRNGVSVDFKRDKEGSIVFSKLDEKMLSEVADLGNGEYFRLSQGIKEVRAVKSELNAMEKQEFEERVFADYEDQFQWFLLIAIFFITVEYFVSERKNTWFSDWSIFK